MNNIFKFFLIFIAVSLVLHFMYYYMTNGTKHKRHDHDYSYNISTMNPAYKRKRRGINLLSNRIKSDAGKKNLSLPACPSMPEKLGPVSQYIDTGNSTYLPECIPYSAVKGGWSKPSRCRATQPVAIIVPYVSRDNKMFLPAFLYAIHPILAKQLLDYRIFVVQSPYDSPYLDPPGKLMNIGVQQARRFRPDWSCYIFHHPQMLPLNSKNMYQCGTLPRQLAKSFVLSNLRNETEHFILIRSQVRSYAVGGVLAMTYDHVEKVNGFTNTILDMDDVFTNMIDRINKTFVKSESNNSSISEYAIVKPSVHRLYRRYFSKFSGWIHSPWNDTLNDGLTSPSLNDDVSSIDVKETFLHTSILVNYKKP